MWRRPCADRAWHSFVVAVLAEVIDRGVDYLRFGHYSTSLTATGHVHQLLELGQLALAIVVLPLAVLLARRVPDVPPARVVAG